MKHFLILFLATVSLNIGGTQISFDLEHLRSIGARPYLYNEIYQKVLKKEPVIAILDTGFAPERKDFINYVHPASQTISGKKIKSRKSKNMHGSHVSCLAGGLNGEFAGVAPNSKILMIDIKDFTNYPTATISPMQSLFDRIMQGMEIALKEGADVINFSGGIQNFTPTQQQDSKMRKLLKKLNQAGVLTVFPSGNNGKEITETIASYYPQRYSSVPGVIVVGSYDTESLKISSFSNYSEKYVDLYAPGAVQSQTRKGLYSCWGESYKRKGGTSMASPVVAGAIALVIRKFKVTGRAYKASDIEKHLLTHSLEIKMHERKEFKNPIKLLNLPKLLL